MFINKDHIHWLEKISPDQMQSASSDVNGKLFSSHFQTSRRIKTAERFTGHCRAASGFIVFTSLFHFCWILLAQLTNCSRKSKMWNALAFKKGQHANLVKITGLILLLALFHFLTLLLNEIFYNVLLLQHQDFGFKLPSASGHFWASPPSEVN